MILLESTSTEKWGFKFLAYGNNMCLWWGLSSCLPACLTDEETEEPTLGLPGYCFVRLLFCQVTVLSCYCFFRLLFFQVTVFSSYFFFKLLFCQVTVCSSYFFSGYCFFRLLFCQVTVFSGYCFFKLLFCQVTVFSGYCFVRLPFFPYSLPGKCSYFYVRTKVGWFNGLDSTSI